jgi:hypothetical protein
MATDVEAASRSATAKGTAGSGGCEMIEHDFMRDISTWEPAEQAALFEAIAELHEAMAEKGYSDEAIAASVNSLIAQRGRGPRSLN